MRISCHSVSQKILRWGVSQNLRDWRSVSAAQQGSCQQQQQLLQRTAGQLGGGSSAGSARLDVAVPESDHCRQSGAKSEGAGRRYRTLKSARQCGQAVRGRHYESANSANPSEALCRCEKYKKMVRFDREMVIVLERSPDAKAMADWITRLLGPCSDQTPLKG